MTVATPPPKNKKFFNPVPIDLDTYQSGGVDFYRQALDLKTVTGVGVDDDEDTELKEYGIAGEEDGGGGTQDDALDNLNLTSIKTGESMFPGGTGIEYNKFDYQQFETYSDYLSTEKPPGYDDRLGTITNIIEPLVDGRLSDINWSAQSKAIRERIENASIKDLSMDKKDIVKAGLTGMAGVPGAVIGSIATSDTSYKNAFNEDQPKMSGIFGLISDTVAATQYQDMAHNRAVANAFAADFGAMREVSGDFETDEYGNPLNVTEFAANRDLGFSMKFGSGTGASGITRKAGTFTYTGNLRGLDNQTLKNIEAVQRGFIPSTFGRRNFGFDYTGRGATTFEGGGYSDAITGNGDRYTDDGKYMDGFGRVSMMGRASDMRNLAKSHGITEDQAKKAVQDARAGKGTVRSNIAAVKAETTRVANVSKNIADLNRESAKAAQERAETLAKTQAEDRARRAEMRREQIFSERDGDGGYDTNPDDFGGGSAETGGTVGDDMYSGDGAMGGQVTAKGFRRYAMGGTAYPQKEAYTSGFIDRPPSQVSEAGKVADDKPLKAPEGSFVLNAAAIEHMGESDVRKMIMDAQKEAVRRGVSTDDFERHSDLIDIAISSGEAIIAPHLVKIIGEDRLEKINKRGLRKTEERVQRTKQEKPVAVSGGGFISRKKFAKGEKVTVYRGEPIDPSKVSSPDYGYGKEGVGKFHTPDVKRARTFAGYGAEKGNQVIRSRKVTVDELFDGVKEAWKIQQKRKTGYFKQMSKKSLNDNLKFVDNLKRDYATGKRSLEDMAVFLQEQVFHDGKSKINFIETFKNDPKSAGKLAGRAIAKVATVATPPLAFLAGAAEMLIPSSLGKGTRYDDSFMSYQYNPNN